MPVPRTTYQKAEAKYNVTTECVSYTSLFHSHSKTHSVRLAVPSLGLHSAAATGNVGLVGYALDHGQPINSVLDGVLPLHAACAGGNVQVVKLLIDHGADVNAPRSAFLLFLQPLLIKPPCRSLIYHFRIDCRDGTLMTKIEMHPHR